MKNGAATVVVVDDEPLMLEMVSVLLRSRGFEVRTFRDGQSALAGLLERPADLLLTDIYMPQMNGISLMARFRAFDPETPVILMTAAGDMEVAMSALKMRAFDLILKPFHPMQLLLAVEKAIRLKRELLEERRFKAEVARAVIDDSCQLIEAIKRQHNMSIEIVERLVATAELRDQETGEHISRIGSYAAIMARQLGMPESFCTTIAQAAPMHDIGKIGIPDAILLKPGPLTFGEFEIIKTHTVVGEQILAGFQEPMLQMAASIAVSHHEKWDGSGYPAGLAGEEIPLAGRITMIADQYDALRSRRSYKAPLDHQAACAVILEGDAATRPGHFDPSILAAFRGCRGAFRDTFAAASRPQHRLPRRGSLDSPSPTA